MDSLETLRQELDHLDNTTQSSNDTTIESVRECLNRPLAMLSPGLIKHTTWKRHIWTLLHTLIPRWAFILTTTTDDRDALLANLIGSPSSCSEQLQSAMAQVSLPLLLEFIRDHHTSTSATSMDVLDLYTSLLKQFCSASMVAIYLRQAVGFIDRLSFGSLVCSIPSRLSNAYGLQHINNDDTLETGHAWYSDSRFYSTLTKHVAMQVGLLCKEQTDSMEMDKNMTEAVGMASELIGKMIRQGYQDTCIETIVPIAIQHNSTHASQKCSKVWDMLWTLCEKVAPAEKLYSAILGYLNKHVEPLRQQRASSSHNNDLSPCSIRLSIQSMAAILSPVLFTSATSSSGGSISRLQQFLTFTLKDTTKIRRADDLVLRTMVAIAVHSAGLEPLGVDEMTDDRAMKLSLRATNMVDQYLRNVLECWTDPVLIKQASDGERRFITILLLILFGYADTDMMEDIEHSTGILQGISTWFRTSDETTAKLAMIVAESMSLRTRSRDDAVLDFGIPMDQQLKDLQELALVADGLTRVVDDPSLLLLPKNDLPARSDSDDDLLDDTDQYLDPDALVAPDDEEDEEETSDLEPYPMEEESDDDDGDGGKGDVKSDPKKKKVRIPVYASELVAYIKDQEDPEKLEIGLNAAEKIIRQNTNVGTEIAEWAIEIGKRLIYFPETYEIDNYWKLQQASLAALIVACPKEIAGFVTDQFFCKDTSIGQKNMIMATISMAVLELSGWDSSSNKDVNLNMDMLDRVAPSMDELSKPNKSGQLVFSSTRAQAELKRQNGIVRNRLSGLAGPIFFFPLVIGWWEASQTRLRWMAQDPMLVERFIMTLNVIMQCASNTPDKKKIVKEYFDYALSLRYIPKLSTRILRALLLGINTILHICYKNQGYMILTEFTLELAGTEKWLEDILEMPQHDKELQQLAMTLLISIGQLARMESYDH